MIEIMIGIKNDHIADSFKKENMTMNEVGVVLLKLKQIEQELISIEWDNDFEIKTGG